MSEVTRRDLLHRLALAISAAGVVDARAAAEAHHAVRQAIAQGGGRYRAKALSAHEFRTLERLTDLIIPREETKPGALQCDVAAWIDSLLDVNAELKGRYVKGLAWVDAAMTKRGAADFVSASTAEQTALLDLIAYQRNRSEALDPGIDFFVLARRMTADGFYTSPIGMRDVYLGNSPQATFTVPDASMQHVLGRSPLNR
jgi:hypothetical protein